MPNRLQSDARIHNTKVVLALAIGFSAWAIGASVISFHLPEYWEVLPYFALIGLWYLQGLGALALLGVSNRPRQSRDIFLGALSAVLMLVLAPESIRIGLVKVPISYRWIVASGLGTVAVIAYLWLALRYWRARRAVA